MKCPRCQSTSVAAIGHDDHGERFQCRVCTNDWYVTSSVPVATTRKFSPNETSTRKPLPDIDVNLEPPLAWIERLGARADLLKELIDHCIKEEAVVLNKIQSIVVALQPWQLEEVTVLRGRQKQIAHFIDYLKALIKAG